MFYYWKRRQFLQPSGFFSNKPSGDKNWLSNTNDENLLASFHRRVKGQRKEKKREKLDFRDGQRTENTSFLNKQGTQIKKKKAAKNISRENIARH